MAERFPEAHSLKISRRGFERIGIIMVFNRFVLILQWSVLDNVKYWWKLCFGSGFHETLYIITTYHRYPRWGKCHRYQYLKYTYPPMIKTVFCKELRTTSILIGTKRTLCGGLVYDLQYSVAYVSKAPKLLIDICWLKQDISIVSIALHELVLFVQ